MIWKPVKGYEGKYEISECGQVKSLSRKIYRGKSGASQTTKTTILKLSNNRGGYVKVILSKNGKKKTFSVHRLVAIAFLQNPLNKTQVNHKDGDKENNHCSNLEWVTPQENMRHAIDAGLCNPTINLGTERKNKKLNENIVREIRQMRYNGSKLKVIASKYNVSVNTISLICMEKIWRY